MAFSVPERFHRNAKEVLDAGPPADIGLTLIEYMCERIGVANLDGLDVLDFGCGSRFADSIVTHSVPLRSYTGVDVYREMIEFLAANVPDPRLRFVHIDHQNPKYNPGGAPLRELPLPFGDDTFDVACMFSVITHQVPDDAEAIFSELRRVVRDSGWMFFSAILDEGDFGGYREGRPDKPTAMSVYSLEFLSSLVEQAGWRIESVVPPGPRDLEIMDSFACRPA